MHTCRQILGFIALVLLSAILGASVYESVVLVPNFRHDIPNSLEHFRLFMSQANPGAYFRAIAPPTQIALLVSLILSWKLRPARSWYIVALACLIVVDVVTFTFHYPRNHLLFHAPLQQPVSQLVSAAQEWGMGNIGRIALLVVSTIAAGLGLRTTILARPQGAP